MLKLVTYLALICVLFSCKKVNIVKKDENAGLDSIGVVTGIISLPNSVHPEIERNFSKYTNIIAPNGSPIHILAQNNVSDSKILKVVDVLLFFLRNNTSTYGNDKTEVANKMAKNKAAIFLFNDKSSGEKALIKTKNIDLNTQTIYEQEIMVDGAIEYISNSFRDVTYRKVLHFIFNYGIAEVLPDFKKEIAEAANYAIENGYWTSVMTPQWQKEGSLEVNYLSVIFDVYFGNWQNTSTDVAFNGEYFYSSRAAIKLGDTKAETILNNQFFLPYIDYETIIYSNFNGTFKMKYDTASSYTVKSQYLTRITLSGGNNSNVLQNSYDNYIKGNIGINKVLYSGSWNDYIITNGNPAIVEDLIDNRDGLDTLENIEFLQFVDTIIPN